MLPHAHVRLLHAYRVPFEEKLRLAGVPLQAIALKGQDAQAGFRPAAGSGSGPWLDARALRAAAAGSGSGPWLDARALRAAAAGSRCSGGDRRGCPISRLRAGRDWQTRHQRCQGSAARQCHHARGGRGSMRCAGVARSCWGAGPSRRWLKTTGHYSSSPPRPISGRSRRWLNTRGRYACRNSRSSCAPSRRWLNATGRHAGSGWRWRWRWRLSFRGRERAQEGWGWR